MTFSLDMRVGRSWGSGFRIPSSPACREWCRACGLIEGHHSSILPSDFPTWGIFQPSFLYVCLCLTTQICLLVLLTLKLMGKTLLVLWTLSLDLSSPACPMTPKLGLSRRCNSGSLRWAWSFPQLLLFYATTESQISEWMNQLTLIFFQIHCLCLKKFIFTAVATHVHCITWRRRRKIKQWNDSQL